MTTDHPNTVDTLVTFERPPVAEVALAVQFAPAVTDDTITLGRFWPQIHLEYPKVEPQPPLPALEEDFEVPPRQAVTFKLVDGPLASRYWLLNAAETELIQVQPDLFGYNWRREPTDAPYPRYQHVRTQFEAAFEVFTNTIRSIGRDPQPTWCEISYINQVGFGNPGEARPDLSTILRRMAPQTLSALPQPDNSHLSDRFLLERDGAPFGRFYLVAAPTFRPTDRALGYTVTLQVRGIPTSPDLAGVLAFFDQGRALIVESFKEMTTTNMHKEWGLT